MVVVAAVTAAIAPLYPDPRCLRVCLYLFTPSPLVPSPPYLPPPPQLRHRQTIPPFPRALFSPARLWDSPELPLPATFFVRIRLVHRDKAASSLFISRPKRSVGILPRQRPAYRFQPTLVWWKRVTSWYTIHTCIFRLKYQPNFYRSYFTSLSALDITFKGVQSKSAGNNQWLGFFVVLNRSYR